jgi:urease accessory protein
MRGGGARWDVDIEAEDGGCLVWHGEPFVVAEGADVARTLRVDLGATSVVTLRETLVLGRSGEEPGRLRSRTDVSRDGAPVLLEELDSDVGLGVDQVLALGGFEAQAPERRRTSATEPGSMVLASGDRLRRWLGAETHASPIHGCYSRLSYSRLSYSSPRDE